LESDKATATDVFKRAAEAYRNKDYQAALNACESLLHRQHAAESLAAIYNLKALSLAGLGNIIDSVDVIRKALAINPKEARLHLHAARLLARLGKRVAALDHLQSAAILAPADPDPDYQAACLYRLMDQPEAALASALASVSKNSENMEGWMLLAELSAEQGNVAEALAYLQPALEHRPMLVRAWAWLAEMEPGLNSGLPVEECLMQARNEAFSSEDFATAVFALAFRKRQAGLHAEAFALCQEANRRLDVAQPFAIEAWEARVEEIIASSGRQLATPHLDNHNDSKVFARLIFVVGMPRSGTSLCEQILCSHPAVHGAGELPTMESIEKCLRQRGMDIYGPDETGWQAEMQNVYLDSLPAMQEGEQWVIDKTPRNFERLGLILRLFPEARILWMLRHPLDTVLSCFFQDFASSQDYSRRLDHAARVYAGHLRLLRHWKQQCGLNLSVVEYSKLVQNLETTTHGMAEFIGLDFHPAMLEPHLNPRRVRTASAQQVRQPVFTSSLNQWKNYANELGDLMTQMQAQGLIDADGRMAFSI